jgi:PleD family two-component response regulator
MVKDQGGRKKAYPKVLVIDTDSRNLEEIANRLRKEGFRVVRCLTPRGALGRIREELPDAVVVEVILPALSGFEIAARMQADLRLSHIPIFFTTDIQDSDGESCDYFSRPLEMSALVRAIRERTAAKNDFP